MSLGTRTNVKTLRVWMSMIFLANGQVHN